ncbi:MAG: hypothetical protein DMD61_14215, partial [Gemmatimonadetes bacterium]
VVDRSAVLQRPAPLARDLPSQYRAHRRSSLDLSGGGVEPGGRGQRGAGAREHRGRAGGAGGHGARSAVARHRGGLA